MPASGAARVGRSASGGRSNRAARGESWLSEATRTKKREKKNVPRARAHPGHVQQHDRDDHRSGGGVIAWQRGAGRLQGLAQEHAVRRGPDRRSCRSQGDGARRPPWRSSSRAPVRVASRPSAHSGRGPGGHRDHGRDPHSPQRLPPTEAATGLAMSRYTDPVCRICRREGLKLFLKGSRCYSKKCSFERRSTPPGMNPTRRRRR